VRIAYVCYWDAFVLDGVARKLRTQVDTWRQLGHDVDLFCLTPDGPGEPATRGRLFRYRSIRQRIRQTGLLAREVSAWQPDIIYLRADLFAPSVWRLVKRFPTVVEVNGDDRAEARHRRLRMRVLNRFNRTALYAGARGIVAVSATVAANYTDFGKPMAVVANSIDASFAPAVPPPPAGGGLHAVFVSSPNTPWAGVDKVLELARRFADVQFDIVGWSAEDVGEPLPPNARAHGFLSRAEYEPLLAGADVAIGTLALYRAGEQQASPLKVREYLLSGLPVVIGYDDADLLELEPWWLLRIPNTEDSIEIAGDDVRAFIERVSGRRVPREEVEPLIGPATKEARRLAFFAKVIE
jgi:hypothetical protein